MDAAAPRGEHRHTGVEAKEADVSAISWALLGLATGWVVELVHEDELTCRRRVCVFALAAGGRFSAACWARRSRWARSG
jgi:hypothetical protein